MTNLKARLAVRNTSEKFYCEVLYPRVVELMQDLGDRYMKGEKIALADGNSFTKKVKAEVDVVVSELRKKAPKNFHFFIVYKGSLSLHKIDATCTYHAPDKSSNYNRTVTCSIPALYLDAGCLESFKKVPAPIYHELTESEVLAAYEEIDGIDNQLEILNSRRSYYKNLMTEVGEYR